MRIWILALMLASTTARAECSVSADAGAQARQVSPTVKADTDLIIAMTMMPKLQHVDYHQAAARPACDLGPLATDNAAYELWGSDAGGRQRKALPAIKGQPIALLVPVIDMMQALEAAKLGKAATTQGYLLAVVTKADLTGWRFYTAMPDAAALRRDMADALAGTGTPIFRNGPDNQTAIFVPKS